MWMIGYNEQRPHDSLGSLAHVEKLQKSRKLFIKKVYLTGKDTWAFDEFITSQIHEVLGVYIERWDL